MFPSEKQEPRKLTAKPNIASDINPTLRLAGQNFRPEILSQNKDVNRRKPIISTRRGCREPGEASPIEKQAKIKSNLVKLHTCDEPNQISEKFKQKFFPKLIQIQIQIQTQDGQEPEPWPDAGAKWPHS